MEVGNVLALWLVTGFALAMLASTPTLVWLIQLCIVHRWWTGTNMSF